MSLTIAQSLALLNPDLPFPPFYFPKNRKDFLFRAKWAFIPDDPEVLKLVFLPENYILFSLIAKLK